MNQIITKIKITQIKIIQLKSPDCRQYLINL